MYLNILHCSISFGMNKIKNVKLYLLSSFIPEFSVVMEVFAVVYGFRIGIEVMLYLNTGTASTAKNLTFGIVTTLRIDC